MSLFGEYPDSGPPPQKRSWSLYGRRSSARAPRSASCGSSPSLGPCLRRGPVVEPLDEPLVVVALDELRDHSTGLLERLEAVEVEALLLQGPHEALDDAIALRFAHVRGRDRNPEPLDLVDPGVGDVLRPPVAAERKPAGDVLPEVTEGVAHALTDRLEGRPPIAELRDVPPQELVDPVIDGPEEPPPPLALRIP